MFRLIPKTLALMAVQRQTAASRSASPPMRLQHSVFGWLPRTRLRRPLSTLAHAPNLSVSIGQVFLGGDKGVDGAGTDGVGALGVGAFGDDGTEGVGGFIGAFGDDGTEGVGGLVGAFGGDGDGVQPQPFGV
ncbi:hypothetical protein SSX86_028944 [Deinandra increscens subsp. villosa]|uniref:Uncharacterized protein n=1 Tax=Deinandra increscens subsp. villosa TaxID=3103831 RepID=A0AAP0C9K3_9ASTR